MKLFKKILSIIMIIVAVISAGIFIVPGLFGYTPYTVLSGSMERTYPTGSLIFVKSAQPAELKVGDPATFHLASGKVATHRVIKIDPKTQMFTTKGDENNTEDAPTPFYRLIGMPASFYIPNIGYGVEYMQTETGKIIVITALVMVIIILFMPDLIEKKSDNEIEKSKEESSENKL